jgi:hypothetical protein
MLRLGQEVHLPVEIVFGMPHHKVEPLFNPAAYVTKLLERLNLAFQSTRSSLRSSHMTQKKNYDVRSSIRQRQFDIGDIVYLVNTATRVGDCRKLQPLLKGPYVIKRVASDFLYVISDKKGDKVHHHDRLKLCLDRSIPLWVQRLRDSILTGCPFVPGDNVQDICPTIDWLFGELDMVEDMVEDKADVDNELTDLEPRSDILTSEGNSGDGGDLKRFTRRGRQVVTPCLYLD